MADSDRPQYRTVNSLLGAQPKFGPIPGELIIPWFLISLAIYLIAYSFDFPWIWRALLVFWGCGAWWILVGSKPWKFLSKFVNTPTWTKGHVQYRSIQEWEEAQLSPSSSKTRKSAQGKRSSRSRQ